MGLANTGAMLDYIFGSLDANRRHHKTINKFIRKQRSTNNFLLYSTMVLAASSVYQQLQIIELGNDLAELKKEIKKENGKGE